MISLVKHASACYSKGEWNRSTGKVTAFHINGAFDSDLPIMEHAGSVKERIDGGNLAKLVSYVKLR